MSVSLLSTRFHIATRSSSVLCEATASTSIDPSIVSNPLIYNKLMPKFKEINPQHVEVALNFDLQEFQNKFQDFENNLASKLNNNDKTCNIDYSQVIEKLEELQFPLSYSWGIVGHLMGVKNSDDLRKAHDIIQPNVIKIYQKIGQSQVIFKALKKIKDDKELWSQLDDGQKRIVTSSLRQMESSGVGLNDHDREIFNKLKLESAELSTKFSNNVLDSTKAFKLLVENKSDIEGLPESALSLYAKQAVAAGHKDATTENGPWLITLDMPSYLPAMQHLKNRTVREQLYRAYVTRASSEPNNNEDIIKRTLQIKKEISKLLGYNCYAELSLASKMAPSTDKVLELIEMLHEKSFVAAKKELEELKAFAKEQGCNDELSLWDVPFYSERLREKLYQYEEEALKPYFALPNVLDGIFGLCNRLFGITIEAADGEVQVWNDDVRFFKIKDTSSGEHIASFYLDPYSRPLDKRSGAWMDSLQGKSKVLNNKPVAYLTCNGAAPVGDKPSLMTFREVETLAHELGHGLQHMLTTVEHGDAAGINNVEWDAVELPSQFMENWMYDRKTLYGFAKHYETGELLPEEVYQKLLKAKNFQAGMIMIRQLFFGAMDMELHSEKFDPYGTKSVFDIQREMSKKYTVLAPLPEDRFLCSFGHIFAGGYSAGYYSYKWAEVMSADAFAAFEEAGLDDENNVKVIGRKFRNTVLALGGSKHPSEVFELFRGRNPSPEALLRHSGLTK